MRKSIRTAIWSAVGVAALVLPVTATTPVQAITAPAVALAVPAAAVPTSAPAFAQGFDEVWHCDDYTQDGESGAVTIRYKGGIHIDGYDSWQYDSVDLFYNDGQGGYKTQTWYDHDALVAVTGYSITFAGMVQGPSANMTLFNGFCHVKGTLP